MNRNYVRTALCAWVAGLLVIFAAACGSSEDPAPGAKKLSFELTDEGCFPHDATAPAGPIAFEIENGGTSTVTEMEIMDGEEVLGEEENVTDGLAGSFSATLAAGKYTIYCPGSSDERGTLTVTGSKHVEGATKGENDADEGK